MFKKLEEMRKTNGKKGFTLIELIVVLAILGVLMTLAVPAYNGLQDQAAERVAKSNAREVYTAVMAVKALDGTVTAAEVAKMIDGQADDTKVKFSGGEATWTETNGVFSVTWTGNGKTGTYTPGQE